MAVNGKHVMQADCITCILNKKTMAAVSMIMLEMCLLDLHSSCALNIGERNVVPIVALKTEYYQ